MPRPPRSAVRAAVRGALADLEPGDRVLVGLSGGPDSLALTAAAARVAAERGLVCDALVVDHGLQLGSAGVAHRAAAQALRLGCASAQVVAVSVPAGPGHGGPEAAARAARYEALDRAARSDPPAAAVLLGHTRDDQAETVLLGLARGSGTRAVAGMAPRSGAYRRPLLDLPRDLVARAAAEAAAVDPRLAPWTDPHNADAGYARVRVRTDVLPALEGALGPGVAAALARTARLARADADALDEWARRVLATAAPGAGDVDARAAHLGAPGTPVPGGVLAAMALDDLAGLPGAVLTRVVRLVLLEAGCPAGALSADHVWRVAALAGGGSGEVALPGGGRARREAGRLVVRA